MIAQTFATLPKGSDQLGVSAVYAATPAVEKLVWHSAQGAHTLKLTALTQVVIRHHQGHHLPKPENASSSTGGSKNTHLHAPTPRTPPAHMRFLTHT